MSAGFSIRASRMHFYAMLSSERPPMIMRPGMARLPGLAGKPPEHPGHSIRHLPGRCRLAGLMAGMS